MAKITQIDNTNFFIDGNVPHGDGMVKISGVFSKTEHHYEWREIIIEKCEPVNMDEMLLEAEMMVNVEKLIDEYFENRDKNEE